MENKFIKTLLVVLVLSIIAIFSYYYFTYHKVNAKDKEVRLENLRKKDSAAYVRQNNALANQARESYLAKDYKKSLDLSIKMFSEASQKGGNIEEKEYAEFSVGQAYFLLKDYANGVKVFISVFNNLTYDKYTRVAALNTIMQEFKASSNVRPYLENEMPELKGLSDHDFMLSVYKKMYVINPTAHATAFLATDAFMKLDKSKKNEAQGMFNVYVEQIDKDIKIQSEGVASNYIVPNLIIAKAKMYIVVYDKFNISSVEEISRLFEEGIKSAQDKLNPITEQFALLSYMDFLGSHQQPEKAVIVFTKFSSQETTEMVLNFLKNKDINKEYPGIVSLYKKNKNIQLFFDSKK